MRSVLLILMMISAAHSYGQEYKHVMVFLNSKHDKEVLSDEESEALQKAHRANIKLMVTDGKLSVAGPFEGGGGIFILNTGKVLEAKNWLSADPAIKANRWNIELFPINFLKGNACLAQEPNEMVTYNFIRVHYINDIANYKVSEGAEEDWQAVASADGVLLTGVFPNKDGGIMIYSGEKRSSWFGENQNELVSLEDKTVWVAKGSFCE